MKLTHKQRIAAALRHLQGQYKRRPSRPPLDGEYLAKDMRYHLKRKGRSVELTIHLGKGIWHTLPTTFGSEKIAHEMALGMSEAIRDSPGLKNELAVGAYHEPKETNAQASCQRPTRQEPTGVTPEECSATDPDATATAKDSETHHVARKELTQ